jgi:NAD(P)-dependent dehydrogenase (short-subunit alcohol dehydrogenase family)
MTEAGATPNLAGGVAVVTGAGRGLGREVAIALAARGINVVLAGRTAADLEATARLIRAEAEAEAVAVQTDVRIPRDVAALRAATEREFGPAGVLVNAAGIFGPITAFGDSPVDEWMATQEVNLFGPFLTCREFVPKMLAAGWGRIVNVSSAGGILPPVPFDSAYATSKAALNRLTRQLAIELEGTGVTANAIHPGSLKTDMWAEIHSKVTALGEAAGGLGDWVRLVEATGGDSPAEAVAVVIRLIEAPAGVNGEFHWPQGGHQEPVASW